MRTKLVRIDLYKKSNEVVTQVSAEYNLRTELGSHFIHPNQHDSAGTGTEVDALYVGACKLSDSQVAGIVGGVKPAIPVCTNLQHRAWHRGLTYYGTLRWCYGPTVASHSSVSGHISRMPTRSTVCTIP